ncbi:RimJ/RimL family protein N-acetyltransferase [Arthrobacter pigmenti]|uniref:RimJ/RimL family protein N-acetyltransferase n=1 Tax=Arthrobacter pigmenti TaxID=271432 RepID=A0A846RLB9_9MICC|nr:RimJ/RimL family protein N-acetyltransferase [Arthrobacter pigmenti]
MGDLPRIRLRPLHLADAAVIAHWGDDSQFCVEADWATDVAAPERYAFWRNLIENPPADLIRLGAVGDDGTSGRNVANHEQDDVSTDKDVLLGYVDLHGTESGRRELGYLIGQRSLWGRGLGISAALAGLHYAFDELQLHEVWAEALAANEPSVRILQRLGMRETGRGTDETYLGRKTFHRQFAITSAEWRNSPADCG